MLYRQIDNEAGVGDLFALRLDRSAMQLHESFHQGETDAGSLRMYPIHLIETVEDMREIRLGDALSCIFHREGQRLRVTGTAQEYLPVLW